MAKPPIEANVEGVGRLLRKLRMGIEAYIQAASGALYEEGEETMTLSKTELVPVDEGILRGSGHVELPEKIPNGVEVVLGFGGPAAGPGGEDVGYAVYVHEDLTARHRVGQAKYLEEAIRRRRPGMEARLVNKIKRKLGGRL